MFSLLFLMGVANADVSMTIVNNTRLEFDTGSKATLYVANEVSLKPYELGSVVDKNKFRLGIRHKVDNNMKLDPHIYIQNQRMNDWALEYGPTLRLDVSF
jgi:hypothetical protein